MENIIKTQSMSFSQSVKSVFDNLLNFKGRARRSELWWFYLLYTVVSFVCGLLLTPWPVAAGICSLVLILLIASVTVRRLHDRGHSGWWVAISIIVSTFLQFYYILSGFYDIMNTVNPDPEALVKIFLDPIVMICTTVSFVVNITIFVFCVLDGKPERNKYGISPKYINTGEELTL